MYETETAPAESAAVDEAAGIICAWLERHEFKLVEIVETDPDGREWSCCMKILPSSGKTVFMNKAFPVWDWAGLCRRSPGETWLEVANWLFGLRGKGPSRVQATDESRPSPGRAVFRKKRFPVPKLAFSSLEEFVLKASASPDFQGIS